MSKKVHQEHSRWKDPLTRHQPQKEKALFKTPEKLQKNPDQHLKLLNIMNKEDKTTQTHVSEDFDAKVIINEMSVDIWK